MCHKYTVRPRNRNESANQFYLRLRSFGVLRRGVLHHVPLGRIDELERLDVMQQPVGDTERYAHPEIV